MTSDYGNRYPGAGGARSRPLTGGDDWYPMPEGMCEQVPLVSTHVEREEPGFFGRLIGRPAKETVVETIVGHTVRKHYR